MPKMDIRAAARKLHKTLEDGGWLAVAATSLFMALAAVLMQGLSRGETFHSLRFVANLNWILFFGVGLLGACFVLLLTFLWDNKKPLGAALLLSYLTFALFVVSDSDSDIYFMLGLCLPLFFILRWIMAEDGRLPRPRPEKRDFTLVPATIFFLGFTVLLSYFAILRYRAYYATTFDLGLFAQMFEQLRRTGHALTTLERNELLTHFGVHCSPIYYLLLPFYMLVPRVETLLALQAASISAGVFAVRAIVRHLFGDSPNITLAACMVYIFNPALGQWALWDFHENKFLPALLLWAFYFLLRNKTAPLLIFSALILMVKEDAAIYVIALALYFLFQQPLKRTEEDRGRVLTSFAMIAMSVVWFIIALGIIQHYGNGAMVDRLRNYFLPKSEGGFGDIIRVCLSNLAYVVGETFTKEKAEFLLWVFLPLGFLPFLQKKGAAWLLLLPMLVINLMPNYSFQYALGYQYACGSLILALALSLVTLKGLRPRARTGILIFAVSVSILCTIPILGSRFQFYNDTLRLNPDRIAAVDQALEELNALPQDVEITATTFHATHLYQRDRVYLFPHFFGISRPTEYLVCKPEEAEKDKTLIRFIAEHDYQLEREVAFLQIYRLPLSD